MKTTIVRSFLLTSILAAILGAGCNTTQSPHRLVDDVKITAQVKSKLAEDVVPSSIVNIEVNTTNGVVTLAGQVESEQVKEQAALVALHVHGVAGVNNNLQVEPAPAAAIEHSTS